MADNEAIMKKLEEQDSLIRRLTMELNRLTKGKGIADDGAGGDTTGGIPEDEEVYVELGAEVSSRRQQRRDEDVAESALLQVFKKAKLSEFDGEKKSGEDLEAWLEDLRISLPFESLMKWERLRSRHYNTWSCKAMVEVACTNPTTSRSTHHMG